MTFFIMIYSIAGIVIRLLSTTEFGIEFSININYHITNANTINMETNNDNKHLQYGQYVENNAP